MRSKDPEEQFAKIRRYQRVAVLAPITAGIIAVAILILEGFGPYPESLSRFISSALFRVFDGLYFGVLALLLITLIPVALLLVRPDLRKTHFAVRLDLIYRYLVYAWIVFFASRIMVSIYHAIYWFPEVLLRNILLGVSLKIAYLLVKRKYAQKPEALFP